VVGSIQFCQVNIPNPLLYAFIKKKFSTLLFQVYTAIHFWISGLWQIQQFQILTNNGESGARETLQISAERDLEKHYR